MCSPIFIFFIELALKKNTLTPYIALGKTNPLEFPRYPASYSKIKGCKISVWSSLPSRQPERHSTLIQLKPALLLHFKLHIFTMKVR